MNCRVMVTRRIIRGFVRVAYELMKEVAMVRAAKFVTVWDGCVTVTTDCKVDTGTNEVFDIQCVDVDMARITCFNKMV